MTVEQYLRSLVPGLDLPADVIARAARSPIEVGLERLNLDEDVDYIDIEVPNPDYVEGGTQPPTITVRHDRADDEVFQTRLDYASSTVYYSVLGVFAGGGYSESVGDVRVSKGGYTITMADRARFKLLADALREKHGFIKEVSTDNGAYDYTYLRK